MNTNLSAGANRQRPSGVAQKTSIFNVHLVPFLGSKKLDAITTEDVQRLKSRLEKKAAKTVNNVISVLNTALKKAVEWGVIDEMPCAVRLLPVRPQEASFYDFEQYERLVATAKSIDRRTYLLVLLGGEAGLRCGEMMALQWADVDLAKRQLRVRHSIWKGHTTVTKGGRPRFVPLTVRLTAALREHRHLRGQYVLCAEKGEALTQKMVQDDVRRAERRAGLEKLGVHILRHSFCSHLAMRGAPARAIQELAGHQDLTTTQRYMHLSPAAIENAIRLLDDQAPGTARGEKRETASS